MENMEDIKKEQDRIRTPEEEFLDLPPIEDYNSIQYSLFLDQIFSLGTIQPETFKIFEGLYVTLRVLLPVENLEVSKKVDTSPGMYSKDFVLKLETLARSIERVNGQYLRFSESMIKEWQDFRNTTDKPTEVEQQRYILLYRFKTFIINEIFKRYSELLKKQEEILTDLKKN